MTTAPLSPLLPKPRQRRAHVTEALYGDRISFTVGGVAVALAAAVTAWRTGVDVIWYISALTGLMTAVRLLAFELFTANEQHADRHPQFWRWLYASLGVVHMFIIGVWSTAVYWLASDHFSEILSVVSALAYMIGTQGRNFASISLIRAQLIACLVPILVAFAAHSLAWPLSFSVFVAAFYFAVLNTSRRIRLMFRRTIEASEENWRLAHMDALTGVANRISMQDAMSQAMDERKPFTLHYVNVDHFKRVNEVLGSVAGDQLLRQTASRLANAAGPDCLVSRYAGDEFVVFQLLEGEQGPADLAARLLAAVGQPVTLNGVTMPSSCSIGYASYPQDAGTMELVGHLADMAQSEAKAAGGGRVEAYHPGTPDRAAERLHLENDLRQALQNGSLEMFFQPIVFNRTFDISGCEALVRWSDPERGWVSPGEFLPVAEDAGLIEQLTDFTFRTACRAATTWPADIGVSVNLSPSQLRRPDLLTMIEAAVREAGLDFRRLEIEITENLFLADSPEVRERLQGIREMGARLSLDDFGTGYSNLVQIALLPLDKIKLDRSFLKDIGTDERRAAVLRGAVQFISQLGLEIVLEGVETADDLAFATSESGITHLQGYHFALPLSEVAVADFLHRRVGGPALAHGASIGSPNLQVLKR